jgi:3-deoxy-7-phosphoheptulonate synthase
MLARLAPPSEITGNEGPVDPSYVENMPGVAETIRVTKPYKLITLDLSPDKTIVRVGDATIGGNELALIAALALLRAAPRHSAVAEAVSRSGARFFAGGLSSLAPHLTHFKDLAKKG